MSIETVALTCRFGDLVALDAVDLAIGDGELFVVLGASGCGKSTLLRAIAGLERPDAGCVRIDGRVVADGKIFVPSEARGVGVVFQSYALWPHMTVAEHAEFPLRVAGLRGEAVATRAREALCTVGLEGLAGRRPAELSGGQRQRVALARCLAQGARTILMDEPLANLDPHLREAMEREIARVQRASGATVLYITHDQREAMALADRICVLEHGRVRQVGTPETLYREPANRTVAAFVGDGTLLEGRMSGACGARLEVAVGDARLLARAAPATRARMRAGDALALLLRPESLALAAPSAGERNALPGRVARSRYRGAHHDVEVALEGDARVLVRDARARVAGERVAVCVADAWALPQADARDIAAPETFASATP